MFIKSRYPGNVFAYDHPNLAVDLRHESTHAVLHSHLPHVPLWLDEGLAEYFEVETSKRASKNSHLTSIRRAVIWRRAPSLQRLERLESLSEMAQREYRDAWAWVHFMVHGPESARTHWVNYIRDIQHETAPEPLSRRFARSAPGIDGQFVDHFKKWK